jgi:large subunit ribosomal protein L15
VKIHELKAPHGSKTRRKRVGRGEGSGRGKTAGRGTKGTMARGRLKTFFEGGQMPLVRRLPKLKGFSPPARTVYSPVNISSLARIDGSEIGPDELRSAGLVSRRGAPVKVLGKGEINRAVTVRAHAVSKSARGKIEAAGGSVELLPLRGGPR